MPKDIKKKNIMFVYENKKERQISYIETIFKDYHFLHLTGIKYSLGARQFYYDCLKGEISPKSIEIKSLIFTKLKLEILENVMSINKFAKRIGTYNYNKTTLKIEKVVGNVRCCLGFSNKTQDNQEVKYYYPKTLLQEDFNKNISDESRIIAIFSKDKNMKLYNEVTYLSNNIDISEILNDSNINRMVDYKNIGSVNAQYQEKIATFFKEIGKNLT